MREDSDIEEGEQMPESKQQEMAGVLKNITNKIINRALANGDKHVDSTLVCPLKCRGNEFTFSEEDTKELEQPTNDSNFTFQELGQEPSATHTQELKSTHAETQVQGQGQKQGQEGKPIRILDLLPSKIQERYNLLKARTLVNLVRRMGSKRATRWALETWKYAMLQSRMQNKVQEAADMVDKMSKVSRSFISLNALGALVARKDAVALVRAMAEWRHTIQRPTSIPTPSLSETAMQTAEPTTQSARHGVQDSPMRLLAAQAVGHTIVRLICRRQSQLLRGTMALWEVRKQKELAELKTIVKQYSYWEQKINDIEARLKRENEELAQRAQALQTENGNLQAAIADKNRELVEKIDLIQTLGARLKEAPKGVQTAKAPLEPVVEAVCSRCKESLEESRNFGEKGISALMCEGRIKELETEVRKLTEAVQARQTAEAKAKKELEDQVDLVLKMEEERLLLIKESKRTKEELARALTRPSTTEVSVNTEELPIPLPNQASTQSQHQSEVLHEEKKVSKRPEAIQTTVSNT